MILFINFGILCEDDTRHVITTSHPILCDKLYLVNKSHSHLIYKTMYI